MRNPILKELAKHGEFASLSHGKVRFEVAGPDNGIPVLLVHGLAGHFHIWDRNFHVLAEAGFRVLRTDLYGRGFSDRVQHPHNSALYIAQLDELLRHVNMHGRVSLVGLSMGGAIITRFASAFPDRVRSMLWVDSYGMPIKGDPLVGLSRVPLLGEAVMGTLGGLILRKAPDRGVHRPHLHKGFKPWFTAPLKVKGTKRALLSSLRHFMAEDHTPHFRAVNEMDVPKLMVWGTHDRILPLSYGRVLHTHVPSARFEEFSHSGHLPHFEEPEKFNQLSLAFISDVR